VIVAKALTPARLSQLDFKFNAESIVAQADKIAEHELQSLKDAHEQARIQLKVKSDQEITKLRSEYSTRLDHAKQEVLAAVKEREDQRLSSGRSTPPESWEVTHGYIISLNSTQCFPGTYLSAKFSGIFEDVATPNGHIFIHPNPQVAITLAEYLAFVEPSNAPSCSEAEQTFCKMLTDNLKKSLGNANASEVAANISHRLFSRSK
jgi:hypothetical protein